MLRDVHVAINATQSMIRCRERGRVFRAEPFGVGVEQSRDVAPRNVGGVVSDIDKKL